LGKAKNQNPQNTAPAAGGAQYPQSGMPYPQSGMPYPQTGVQYPRSGMPYPQSGMPYPQSGMPYPQAVKPKKKKMSNTTFAVIAAAIVLVWAAICFILVVQFGKNDEDISDDTQVNTDLVVQNVEQNEPEEDDYTKGLPKQEDYIGYNVTPTIMVDGNKITLSKGMMNIDNSNMASLNELAGLFGFEVETDLESRTYTLKFASEEFVFTHGKATCTKYKADGSKSTIGITKAPIIFSNGEMYVAVSGTKSIFGFENIKWDNTEKCVSITTGDIKLK